ncbi:HTH-type transcriptional regulator ArgP [compost metagenome]
MIHTQIRAFDAVARSGSFSRAAEVLSLTQPAVTIQVKALEEAYGVQLLRRHGRGVELTEIGQRVFRLTREMANVEQALHDLLVTSDDLQGNKLRLAVDGPHVVMRLLGRFQKRYPGVALSVAMGNTRFVHDELLERRADAAILPGIKGHPAIHARPLWRHTAVLIVPPGHALASAQRVSFSEIGLLDLVRRETGSMTQKKIDGAFRTAGIKPNYILELGSREALCEAVAAGLGCGIVWDSEAQGSSRWHTVAIRGDPIESIDHVACLKAEANRPVLQAFFNTADDLAGNMKAGAGV